MNPLMDNHYEDPNPSFSLARTFPHQVRFKNQRQNPDKKPAVQPEEKGEAETAPQVGESRQQRGSVQANDARRHDSYGRNSNTEQDNFDDQPTAEDEETGYQFPSIPQPPTPSRQFINRQSEDKTNLHPIPEDQVPDNESEYQDFRNQAAMEQGKPKPFNQWAKFRMHFQRPLAEWLGTTILIFIGISGNLSVVTSDFQTGSMQCMYWCWGFAVMLAIYIAGGGSGAFLNPSLTIMLSVFRGFPARRVPIYILVQLLGAYTGALLAFAVYRDDILHYSSGILDPASTGPYIYTQPKDWISNSTAFFTEMLGTAVIGCSILALGDSSNSPPGAGMHAFIIGLLTTTVTMSLGFSTGGCFNPVRDIGPRLAAITVGYPTSLFNAHQYWWIWGPCCATVTGALLGGLVYDLCIFKGGESPVNYSCGRWKQAGMEMEQKGHEVKTQGLEESCGMAKMLGLNKLADKIHGMEESDETDLEKGLSREGSAGSQKS